MTQELILSEHPLSEHFARNNKQLQLANSGKFNKVAPDLSIWDFKKPHHPTVGHDKQLQMQQDLQYMTSSVNYFTKQVIDKNEKLQLKVDKKQTQLQEGDLQQIYQKQNKTSQYLQFLNTDAANQYKKEQEPIPEQFTQKKLQQTQIDIVTPPQKKTKMCVQNLMVDQQVKQDMQKYRRQVQQSNQDKLQKQIHYNQQKQDQLLQSQYNQPVEKSILQQTKSDTNFIKSHGKQSYDNKNKLNFLLSTQQRNYKQTDEYIQENEDQKLKLSINNNNLYLTDKNEYYIKNSIPEKIGDEQEQLKQSFKLNQDTSNLKKFYNQQYEQLQNNQFQHNEYQEMLNNKEHIFSDEQIEQIKRMHNTQKIKNELTKEQQQQAENNIAEFEQKQDEYKQFAKHIKQQIGQRQNVTQPDYEQHLYNTTSENQMYHQLQQLENSLKDIAEQTEDATLSKKKMNRKQNNILQNNEQKQEKVMQSNDADLKIQVQKNPSQNKDYPAQQSSQLEGVNEIENQVEETHDAQNNLKKKHKHRSQSRSPQHDNQDEVDKQTNSSATRRHHYEQQEKEDALWPELEFEVDAPKVRPHLQEDEALVKNTRNGAWPEIRFGHETHVSQSRNINKSKYQEEIVYDCKNCLYCKLEEEQIYEEVSYDIMRDYSLDYVYFRRIIQKNAIKSIDDLQPERLQKLIDENPDLEVYYLIHIVDRHIQLFMLEKQKSQYQNLQNKLENTKQRLLQQYELQNKLLYSQSNKQCSPLQYTGFQYIEPPPSTYSERINKNLTTQLHSQKGGNDWIYSQQKGDYYTKRAEQIMDSLSSKGK